MVIFGYQGPIRNFRKLRTRNRNIYPTKINYPNLRSMRNIYLKKQVLKIIIPNLSVPIGKFFQGVIRLVALRALYLSLLLGQFLNLLKHRPSPSLIQPSRQDQEERNELWDIYMITYATMQISRSPLLRSIHDERFLPVSLIPQLIMLHAINFLERVDVI